MEKGVGIVQSKSEWRRRGEGSRMVPGLSGGGEGWWEGSRIVQSKSGWRRRGEGSRMVPGILGGGEGCKGVE